MKENSIMSQKNLISRNKNKRLHGLQQTSANAHDNLMMGQYEAETVGVVSQCLVLAYKSLISSCVIISNLAALISNFKTKSRQITYQILFTIQR
jgi:hypothetical protein